MSGASDDGYRLHALRAMRSREEDERKAELAAALAVTERAQAQVQRCDDAVTAARDAEREHVQRAAARAAQGVAAADMMAARHYRERLIAAIGAAEAAAADARDNLREVESEERETRERLGAAVRERKAVDVHYETWQAGRKRERARKQEIEADDVAQMIRGRDDDDG